MDKYAQFISHKGKKMLFVNCAGLPEPECLAAFEEMKQAIIKDRAGVLVVADLTRVKMTKAIIDKAREVVDARRAAKITDRPNALVGLNAVQKAVLQVFGSRLTGVVDTVDQAKDWLVKEDDRQR